MKSNSELNFAVPNRTLPQVFLIWIIYCYILLVVCIIANLYTLFFFSRPVVALAKLIAGYVWQAVRAG